MIAWRRWWRGGQLEQQLERELRFHLDHHEADLIAQGVTPAEARRRARLAIGGPEQVKEQCRDARGTRGLDDLVQDVRYAWRALRRHPGFAAVTICTLALGGAATTVMFTLVNGVLLRPLAYPEPDRLVELREQTDWSTSFGNRWAFAYPNFLDCDRESRSLELAAWRYAGGTVSGDGEPEYADGWQVSSSLFRVLRVNVHHGRTFRDDEDRPGAPPVAIVSDGLAIRRFGGSAAAVGRPLVFDGVAHTIVGVLMPEFQLRGDADLLVPIGQSTYRSLSNRNAHPGIQVWARLQPGTTIAEAQAELALIARRLAGQYPESNAGRTFLVEPLRPDVGDVGATLWLLLGAVLLVLLIACANVASLLLARAVSRDRELAMRAALGAGRGRLIRQCLTESGVLGLAGGSLGVGLAAAGVRPFIAFWPGGLPRAAEVHVDWHVLAFALGVSLASGFVFGLAPAWRLPTRQLDRTLREGARSISGASRRLHAILVASEVALAVVLLVSAGALARTLIQLSSRDPGVDVARVLVARMALSPAAMGNADAARAAWTDALNRARRVPGVLAAAVVDTVPMRDGFNQLTWGTTAALPPPDQRPLALATSVTPEYLAAAGIPLRRGRFFTDRDRAGAKPVIVIDDIFARRAFGSTDAVGQPLWVPDLGPGPFEIIGVVGHVRHWGLAIDDQAAVRAQLYYPFAQLPDRFVRRWSELMSLVVRTSVEPLSVVTSLRRELRGASNDQVLYEVRTMEQLASGTLARQRFLLLLFGVFAAVALLLASIGLYGVLAYLTSQRVSEIGVRMALGASGGHVVRLVIAQSLGMVVAGVAAGTAAAFAASRVLERLVDGVRPTELSTFVVMIAVLVGAALIASFVPAWRASRVDALTALRHE